MFIVVKCVKVLFLDFGGLSCPPVPPRSFGMSIAFGHACHCPIHAVTQDGLHLPVGRKPTKWFWSKFLAFKPAKCSSISQLLHEVNFLKHWPLHPLHPSLLNQALPP